MALPPSMHLTTSCCARSAAAPLAAPAHSSPLRAFPAAVAVHSPQALLASRGAAATRLTVATGLLAPAHTPLQVWPQPWHMVRMGPMPPPPPTPHDRLQHKPQPMCRRDAPGACTTWCVRGERQLHNEKAASCTLRCQRSTAEPPPSSTWQIVDCNSRALPLGEGRRLSGDFWLPGAPQCKQRGWAPTAAGRERYNTRARQHEQRQGACMAAPCGGLDSAANRVQVRCRSNTVKHRRKAGAGAQGSERAAADHTQATPKSPCALLIVPALYGDRCVLVDCLNQARLRAEHRSRARGGARRAGRLERRGWTGGRAGARLAGPQCGVMPPPCAHTGLQGSKSFAPAPCRAWRSSPPAASRWPCTAGTAARSVRRARGARKGGGLAGQIWAAARGSGAWAPQAHPDCDGAAHVARLPPRYACLDLQAARQAGKLLIGVIHVVLGMGRGRRADGRQAIARVVRSRHGARDRTWARFGQQS
jgi:hypothetical protein